MQWSLNGTTTAENTDLAHRMKVTNLSHSGKDFLLACMQHINIRPHSVSSCLSDSRSGTRFSLHKSAFREISRSLCLFPKYLPKKLQTFVLRASFIIPFWQRGRGGRVFDLSQSKFPLLPISHWNVADYIQWFLHATTYSRSDEKFPDSTVYLLQWQSWLMESAKLNFQASRCVICSGKHKCRCVEINGTSAHENVNASQCLSAWWTFVLWLRSQWQQRRASATPKQEVLHYQMFISFVTHYIVHYTPISKWK